MLQFYLSLVLTDDDRDTVTRIYTKNYGAMMYVAENKLGDRKDAAPDMVHNAMLKIIDKLDSLDLSDDLKTRNLCITIVRNKCFDFLRSKEEKVGSLDEQSFSETEAQIDEIVISEENVAEIMDAIESLDEKYVYVCLMRFVYGYNEKEISELLDVNYNTVRSRINRARKMLYDALRGVQK